MISLAEYLFEASGLDKETKAKHKEIKAFLKDNDIKQQPSKNQRLSRQPR